MLTQPTVNQMRLFGFIEKRATLDDETNMFFFNSPVVNVDPGSLTTTRTIAHPHHFP